MNILDSSLVRLLESLKDDGFDIRDPIFLDWLNTPNYHFHGLTPLEKAQTHAGLLEVKTTVKNLKRGQYVN